MSLETTKQNLQTNDAGENTSVSIEQTLQQRGTRYGSFKTHAELSQTLSSSIVSHVQLYGDYEDYEYFHLEAINMICHKLARIANGDPNYDDSWRDIAGYAQLVVDILNGKDT